MATVKTINNGTGDFTINAGYMSIGIVNGSLTFSGNNASNVWLPNSVGNIGNVGNGVNAIYAASYFFSNGVPIAGGATLYGNANVFDYLGSNSNVVLLTTGAITTTSNVSGNYLYGNGTFITGLPATYGNADVANFLPTYTGNLVSLTGNVQTTANISANGNITGLNMFASNVEVAYNINSITIDATTMSATDINVSNAVLAFGGVGAGELFIPFGFGNRISINQNLMGNAADPQDPQDLATKRYVDAAGSGLQIKQPVKALAISLGAISYADGANSLNPGVGATITSNVNVEFSADGINAFVSTDRVLVSQFTSTYVNGIYTVTNPGSNATPFVLTRSTDCDIPTDFYNAYTLVTEGDTYEGTGWVCTNNAVTNPIAVVDANANISFQQFTATEIYRAGPGIVISPTNVISANVTLPNAVNTINFYDGNVLQVNPNANIVTNNLTVNGNASVSGILNMGIGNIGTLINNPYGNIDIANINCSNNLSITGNMTVTGNIIQLGTTLSNAVGNTTVEIPGFLELGEVYNPLFSNSEPQSNSVISFNNTRLGNVQDPYFSLGEYWGTGGANITATVPQPKDGVNLRSMVLYSGGNIVTGNATSIPASNSAPGVVGQMAFDSTHLYVCIASNTWVRTSLATF